MEINLKSKIYNIISNEYARTFDIQTIKTSDESSLDLLYIMSIGRNVPTRSLTQQSTVDHINEPFVKLFTELLDMHEIPLVLSVS